MSELDLPVAAPYPGDAELGVSELLAPAVGVLILSLYEGLGRLVV